ncbi:hypothetical protein AKJ08_2329 [Vulgatibacter incomptus]|uniref:Uncharacterized protein n=1 Tax=Vulgatibacter incomptus TaxID=1391653 RepID=A0A0K1PEL5_9BACT|nr:hypothetical protein AKJ08_2329 [Vulgatibacter incomptus]
MLRHLSRCARFVVEPAGVRADVGFRCRVDAVRAFVSIRH